MAKNQSRADKSKTAQGVEGEGSTTATRRYNENLGRALADKGKMQRGADAARQAVDGPEGPALREAEKRGKAGPGAAKRRA